MDPKQASGEIPRKEINPSSAGISRREFARRAAFATASAAAIPAALLGEIRGLPERAGPSGRHEARQDPRQNAVPAPNVSSSEAEIENKFESILSKYGSRFSDVQKADIRRLLGETQKQLDRLRAYSLDNSIQPATFLKPLMERTVRPSANTAAHSQVPAKTAKRGR